MRRVIVCGGRDFSDLAVVESALVEHLLTDDIVVHGDATGADRLAGRVASALGHIVERHPADWQNEGRAAGPLRNQRMLSLGAGLVIAFPGGRGTAHMVSIAHQAGVPVVQVAARMTA